MKFLKLSSLVLVLLFLFPVDGFAITREETINRGKTWVEDGIMYSQSRYHEGYRQDCSGFVSMCWDAGTSYTTRNIQEVSYQISVEEMLPGDAVWTPGHLSLFVEWVDQPNGRYMALEESTWGKPALYREKSLPGNAKIYRYDNIEENPVIIPLTEMKMIQLEEEPVVEEEIEELNFLVIEDKQKESEIVNLNLIDFHQMVKN